VLGEVAELHVVAAPDAAAVELAVTGHGLDQRRLPRAVGPHERDVLSPLQPQVAVVEERAFAHLEAAALDL
jgi:hypothetical protein